MLQCITAAGITLKETLAEVIYEATINKKLIIVHFINENYKDNSLISLLCNKDINHLFRDGFCVFIKHIDNANLLIEWDIFANITYVTNTIFVVNLIEKTPCIKSISSLKSSDKLIYELHELRREFDEILTARNEKLLDKCAHEYWHHYDVVNLQRFEFISLQDALDSTINQEKPHLRKMLILFLYKQSSKLTKFFNRYLASGHIDSYRRVSSMVFWNVADSYAECLQETCNKYFDNASLENAVLEEGGVFFIYRTSKMECNIAPLLTTAVSENFMQHILMTNVEKEFNKFMKQNDITDLDELEAIQAFERSLEHGNRFTVSRQPLHQVTKECVQTPCKILLLYIGSSRTKLWQTMSKIERNCIPADSLLLPWMAATPELGNKLAIALRRSFGNVKFEKLLDSPQGSLLMFVPLGGTLVLYRAAKDRDTLEELTGKFRETIDFFQVETKWAEGVEDSTNPANYQQVMCDQMGDRTFDCFRLDEGEGELMRKKVAFAYYGPPPNEDGCYTTSQEQRITASYNAILKTAKAFSPNENVMISFMRICFAPLPEEKRAKMEKDPNYQTFLDFQILPLFGIRKCFNAPEEVTPCRFYVDHEDRVYPSWQYFLENNHYPKSLLIAPKDGHYCCDYNGVVRLEIMPSPACGFGPTLWAYLDIGATAVGLAVAGVTIAAMFSALTVPVAVTAMGLAVGGYSLFRSFHYLYDRFTHSQPMDMSTPAARAAYINIVAGSLGFTSAGAALWVNYMAQAGVNVGNVTMLTMDGLTFANLTANGAATINGVYELGVQWRADGRPNTLALVQVTSSILFFGHAVYNVQPASTMLQSGQTAALTEILDALPSNRQRKTVVRLLNTASENTGSITAGRAEVISYIRSTDNAAEMIRTLTRSTKQMSQAGVRYSVENGRINFNGMEINIAEFGSLTRGQRAEMLAQFPAQRHQPTTPLRTTRLNMLRAQQGVPWSPPLPTMSGPLNNQRNTETNNNESSTSRLLRSILVHLTPCVQTIVRRIAERLINHISSEARRNLQQLFPNSDRLQQVMLIILEYFSDRIRRENGTHSSFAQLVRVFERVAILSMMTMETLLRELIEFTTKWILERLLEQRNDQPSFTINRRLHNCAICQGTYYS